MVGLSDAVVPCAYQDPGGVLVIVWNVTLAHPSYVHMYHVLESTYREITTNKSGKLHKSYTSMMQCTLRPTPL